MQDHEKVALSFGIKQINGYRCMLFKFQGVFCELTNNSEKVNLES